MNTLKQLWSQFLGTPPSDSQFELWLAMHREKTVRHGILKAAEKNMALAGTMTADHKLRFASKVMNSSTAQRYGDKGLKPPTAETGSCGYRKIDDLQVRRIRNTSLNEEDDKTTERQKEQQLEFAERQSLSDEKQEGRLL
jgi:hypothetical protein